MDCIRCIHWERAIDIADTSIDLATREHRGNSENDRKEYNFDSSIHSDRIKQPMIVHLFVVILTLVRVLDVELVRPLVSLEVLLRVLQVTNRGNEIACNLEDDRYAKHKKRK